MEIDGLKFRPLLFIILINYDCIYYPCCCCLTGEPIKFDPNFRGPVQNRKCTDVVCCIIFLIVILGYIALGTVAWFHGDPRKIISPTDSQGQFCGQTDTSNSVIGFAALSGVPSASWPLQVTPFTR
uniref:Solute carrier family 44 member 5b n=1 Tax=Xiphophorus couchianus TaxID=32473 RepID=A0A3B5LQX1_9TELE